MTNAARSTYLRREYCSCAVAWQRRTASAIYNALFQRRMKKIAASATVGVTVTAATGVQVNGSGW